MERRRCGISCGEGVSKPTPIWTGTVDRDGVMRLDSIALFRRFCSSLKNQAVQVTVKKLARRKSKGQLGYLFGIVYPVIADEMGYRDYEIEQVHDAIIRHLRGLKPEPNPLQMRVSLAEMSHEEVSAYIEDCRHWALTEYGIVTPDAEKVEIPKERRKSPRTAAA
jgi:hypothetical protein